MAEGRDLSSLERDIVEHIQFISAGPRPSAGEQGELRCNPELGGGGLEVQDAATSGANDSCLD